MATVSERPTPAWSIDRLRAHFGGIPAERIHLDPRPGTATVKDLIRWNERKMGRLCELIDGCFVEKSVGFRESLLGMFLVVELGAFLKIHPLGVVVGEAGGMEILPGLVRMPDDGFVSWETIGADTIPDKAYPEFAADLAIEVFSPGNTKKEMDRKVEDFFAGGTKLFWIVYPKRKSVDVYTAPEKKHTVKDVLDGGDVLPGFSLKLDELFSTGQRRRST